MRAKVVRVGNSRGIRLPKSMIEQVGLATEVELEIRGGEIIITPVERPRGGWERAAASLARNQNEVLLDPYVPTRFDEQEWEW